MSITSTVFRFGDITQITQRRRETISGRYVYQEREIYTTRTTVKTCPWHTRFINEIGRAKRKGVEA